MTINDIIEASGYSDKQICARYGIPIRTMNAWKVGERKPPSYLLTMLADVFTLEIMLEIAHDQKGAMNDVEKTDRLGADIPGDSSGSSETCKESKSENGPTGEICRES